MAIIRPNVNHHKVILLSRLLDYLSGSKRKLKGLKVYLVEDIKVVKVQDIGAIISDEKMLKQGIRQYTLTEDLLIYNHTL